MLVRFFSSRLGGQAFFFVCLECDLLYFKSKCFHFLNDFFCTGTVLELHDLECTITVREVEPKACSDVLGMLGDDSKNLGTVRRLVRNVNTKDRVTDILGTTAGSRHFF